MLRWAQQFAFALLLNLCAIPPLMAADWQVVRTTGIVWIVVADMEPVRATAGTILPANATLATMSGARATLQHGENLLNLGPKTRIAPQARRIHGLTTVLMPEGELELEIERRNRPHFAVQTPFLAAVVKGTHFTVTVSDSDAAVSLETGRVQVTAFAAGQTVDLTSGQTANVGEEGLLLSGSGALPAIKSVASQAPMVEAAVNHAGGNSGHSNASGHSGSSSNAGGNSGHSNASGHSDNSSNAGGNSGSSNASGHSGRSSNAGGNSGHSNAGGNGNGDDDD